MVTVFLEHNRLAHQTFIQNSRYLLSTTADDCVKAFNFVCPTQKDRYAGMLYYLYTSVVLLKNNFKLKLHQLHV